MALRLSSLDDEARLLASSLWNLSALLEGHRAMRAALAASRRRHARRVRATDEALRETFVLGGEAIRALVLDPHLPAALCPPGPRERLRDAMVRYDALGRRLWEARLGIAFDRRAPARLDAMEISA
jgi:DNA-binding transcriptional regulator PaaX